MRLHLLLALGLFAAGCSDKDSDSEDDDDGGGSPFSACDPGLATGPTAEGVYGNAVYQIGDIVADATFIGPDGADVDMYDMCGSTVMLVHGELG